MVMSGSCHGNGRDHCCYMPGAPEGPGPDGTTVPGVCPFLRRDAANSPDGRRWSCALFNELRDWAKVHTDARYLATVEPLWRNSSPLYEQLWQVGVRCGGWPDGIAALKASQVNNKPELRVLRDTCKAAITAADGGNQAFCCWGGQPPEV